jgi:hypothetical protein
MAESFFEKRKRERGITIATSATNTAVAESPSGDSFFERRKVQRGLTPGNVEAANHQQYAEGMKSSRLMEVDTLKKEQEKKVQDKAANKFLTDNKLDLYSQAGERVKQAQAQEVKAKELDVNTRRLANKEPENIPQARPSYGQRIKQRLSEFPQILQPLAAPVLAVEQAPFMLATRENLGTDNPRSEGFLPVSGGGKTLGQISAFGHQLAGARGAGLGGTQLYNSAGNVLQRLAPGLSNSLGGKVAAEAIKGGTTGVPLNVGATLAANPEASNKEVRDSALYGGGGGVLLGSLGPLVGKAFTSFANRGKTVAPEIEQQVGEMLALPAPRPRGNANQAQTPDVIFGEGKVEPLGLPSGNPVQRTRYTVAGNNQALNRVMTDIKPEVDSIITPPTRRDLLIDYIQRNLEIPKEEIWNMPIKDLQELGANIRQNMDIPKIAIDVARKRGHDLPSLLDGNKPSVGQRVAQNAQERAYGVYPDELPNVRTPQFTRQTTNDLAMPVERVGRAPAINSEPLRTVPRATAQNAPPARPRVDVPTNEAPVRLSDLRSNTAPVRASNPARQTDELGFAQTVRNSNNTADNLIDSLTDTPMVGARTTDVINRQQAANLIERHGMEGLFSKLMGKTKQFSASENTAAQILAKHYSSLGGEANLSKAIDLISKTAKGGREMGQAIQALSQWNKLDVEGALLLGERQLNRGIPTDEWQKLTVAQGTPIKEAAERIGSAQDTRSLADEVLAIVTNKQAGQALTDAEKATIKQFQDQVKLINEKGKGILSKPKANKANETIREVSQIEPKARTRDQVVSFLDAKADKARQRLAASRNRISSTPFDTYADYAIIGASKIAKGAVKLSDFTEQMVRDFGEKIRPHINEVFTKATNVFRKENGLPTIEELDRVVRNAVKNERFSSEEAKQFKAWASEIGHMSDEFKREATQDLQAAMKELGDSTLGQKLSTLQTGAMLLNAVTLERNVIGNLAQLVSEKVNKVATVPIDWTLSKLTGAQRTIFFKTMNQEKFWSNFLAGTSSNWRGVSPNGMLDSYGIHANVFGKKNPLKYVSKLLGASLGGFDHAFYSAAKGDVLATYAEQLGKAQGMSKTEIKAGMKDLIVQLDDRIHELADHAGRYATYQDETLLSNGAEALKRGLNEVSTGIVSRKLVEMGLPKSLSMEGFGAGDILTKFAKTPANLVMRGLDYSPVGFVRSLVDLMYFVGKRERFNQHEAVRTLGRAITGTLGLTGMGYVLADAGILTGSSSMDKDTRSIQEQSGQGAYKVNWSALGRFITSGLDYDAAKYQKGDRLMDWQWLQPAAISVAMGVNANKAVKAKKDGADITGWQVAQKALLGGLQSVLENPMLQGVSNLLDATNEVYKRGDATKFRSIGKGVPATFVPTLLNQWRTATDNKQRETFSANMLTEMGNLMKNKVPGLSKSLPISHDSLGNEREKLQGGKANTVTQYLTAFFSPARMTEYQVSPEAKLVLDIMNQSGDATVLPRIGNKSFHVKQGKNLKDLKVSLTAKQFSEYQKNLGTKVSDELAKKSEYLSNPNVSLENKVKKVNEILTDMGKKAREEIGTEMGYKKKDIKS